MVKMKESWQSQFAEHHALEVELPKVETKEIRDRGADSPVWLHFGGGNLYRGMHAEIAQDLIDENELNAGVVVLETFDDEVIDKAYKNYNNNILQVVMSEDGTLHKRLLASTSEAIYANPTNRGSWKRIQQYFESPVLQFATFTITEKGYHLTTTEGKLLPIIEQDMQKGPEEPQHTMSIVVSLLYARFKAGQLPIAMVTTDNFSKNGEKLQNSVLTIAHAWKEKGHVPNKFINYLTDIEKVTFPWSMIDRITPNPSESILKRLTDLGFDDLEIFYTRKGTNVAPFVNTEEIHYLVIEDAFPNGRPNLAKGGVILTDRETVDKIDVMKVTTCLNPLHTALAVFGSILRFDSIAREMRDPELKKLIEKIGYTEGLPVVADPEIISPREFIDEVVNTRLPNPAIPDTPQRIATDTSQKLAIRFGETINKYVLHNDKSAKDLTFIPLVLAGWLRYLLAVDDAGKAFVPSPDPLLDEMQQKLESVKLGESTDNLEKILHPILSNDRIFGIDLYKADIADKVISYFNELIAGPGAVRATLKKYLA
ncbi:fructuronate reductase [Evansella caseinilytica]|uniref:Fructuronate reductase n=1 Tax=Evansella caseinilytica TaxID=1503961 RepID=A0A1H3HWR9_9BACI|nr:mannitol dehydrogenase family protein [Evansella caseinilytica]SDY19169.1 fructuronate reductase [Evansella caseinilytica]